MQGGVPWTNEACRSAGTVHCIGPFEELVAAERATNRGMMPERPFVLVGQQYLADPERSAGDVHPIWAYAHVPSGYPADAEGAVIDQIERFAPGLRERIVATSTSSPTQIEAANANYVGGDIITGANGPIQVVIRPRLALDRHPRCLHLLGRHAPRRRRPRHERLQRGPLGAAAHGRLMDPATLRGDAARIAFWINTYNERLLGFLAERPRSGHLFRHRRLFRREAFEIGGLAYTLDVIEHGLLRLNARPPYSPRRLLRPGDPRLGAAPSQLDPRIHFALNCGARSCPPVRRYSATGLDDELDRAARSYIAAESSLDRARGELELPGVIKLYRADFGPDAELVELAASSIGGADGEWLREHSQELRLRFARFDWHMVPASG